MQQISSFPVGYSVSYAHSSLSTCTAPVRKSEVLALQANTVPDAEKLVAQLEQVICSGCGEALERAVTLDL